MNIKINYDSKEYELIYNEQSGYYEIELSAEETGVKKLDITATDLLGNIENSTETVRILASVEKEVECEDVLLLYFLDKDTLEIKDFIEISSYEVVTDEETNQKTTFNVTRKIDTENKDFVVLKRNAETEYLGIVEENLTEGEEASYQISCKYISNLFDRDVWLGDEDLIKTTGIEDYILSVIETHFTENVDYMLNKEFLEVEVLTHTTKNISVSSIMTNMQNDIYNFHTFVTNCSQKYNIVLDFKYEDNKIKLSIYCAEDDEEILIDTTVEDVTNYSETFNTSVISKVTVKKPDGTFYSRFLKTDRTETEDMNDENRARGDVKLLTTENADDAKQVAIDAFKSNSYEHAVVFEIYKKSKLFEIDKLKIGAKVLIKTKDNLLESYVSAIKKNESNFIEFTSGNMRIGFIPKLLQERRKS